MVFRLRGPVFFALLFALAAWTAAKAQAGQGSKALPGMLASTPAVAPPDSSEPATGENTEEGFGFTLARMLVVLGVVLGLVYLTLNFGLRRLLGVRAGSSNLGGWVKLLQRIPLDAKKSIYVVKAGGEYLLLGGGDLGVTLLAKLNAEEAERLERERPGGGTNLPPFLSKLLSRRGAPPPPTG
jgi:flagellar protein FliO/FliZ